MPTEIIDTLVDRLTGVRRNANGFVARCPAHHDRRPSLYIHKGVKGWLLNCKAGCTVSSVMGELGLRVSDLFYETGNSDFNVAGLNATAGMNNLIRATRPPPMDWRLTRFDDVAWSVWPSDERGYALACIEHHVVVGRPFDDAMKSWHYLKDTWLRVWIGEAWEAATEPKRNWREVTEWMANQMRRTVWTQR